MSPAQLRQWELAWRYCAALVRFRAEERAIIWQERHLPHRYSDLAPIQLPERLRRKLDRQERFYADRLERARRHEATAARCAQAITAARNAAQARRERQAALF